MDVEEFKKKMRDLFWNKLEESVDLAQSRTKEQFLIFGRFVHIHLCIEKTMNEFISHKLQIDEDTLKKNGLIKRFEEKIIFFENIPNSPASKTCLDALKEINTLRNKMSHRLNFSEFNDLSIKKVTEYIPLENTETQFNPITRVLMFYSFFHAFVHSHIYGQKTAEEVKNAEIRNLKELFEISL